MNVNDDEYSRLRGLGFDGSLNDMEYFWLRSLGYVGSLNDMRVLTTQGEIQVPGGPTLLSPPSGFDWAPPVNVYQTPDGYTTDFDADDWKVAATADVWVSTTGNDTSGTGAQIAPYRTIRKALQEAALRPDAALNIYVQSGVYVFNENFSGQACAKDLNIYAVGGRVRCINKLNTGGGWTLDGANTYRVARASVGQAIDYRNTITMPNGDVIPTLLTKLTSVAAVQATPGSFYSDGTNVWVQLVDGRVPDSGVGEDVALMFMSTSFLCGANNRFYLNGFDIVGVFGSSFNCQPAAGSSVARIVLDDCRVIYQFTTAQGFSVKSAELAILNNCKAYYTEGDAFYYSRVAAGSIGTKAVEINCQSYYCGIPATSASIINGSTNHADGRTLRVGSTYRYTYGPVLADINSVQSWCLGVTALDSMLTTNDSQDSCYQAGNPTGDTTRLWLDGCAFGGSHFDFYAGAGCEIRYKNMPVPTSIGGSGVVGGY